MSETNILDEYKALSLNKAQESMVAKVREKIIKREKPTTEETMNQLFSDVLSTEQKQGIFRIFKKEFGKKVVLNNFNQRQGADMREIVSVFVRGEAMYNQAILYSVLHERDLKIVFLIEQVPILTGFPHYDPKKKRETILVVFQHLRSLIIKPVQSILNKIGNIQDRSEFKQKLQYLINQTASRPVLKKLIAEICMSYKEKSIQPNYIKNITVSERSDLRTLYMECMKVFYCFLFKDEFVDNNGLDITSSKHTEKIAQALVGYPETVKKLNQMSVDETKLFVQSLVILNETPTGAAVILVRKFMKENGESLNNHFERFQKRLRNTY